jgi:hypothetical protein
VIGTDVEDAHIRLQCWKLGVEMAGVSRCYEEAVAKFATAAYNFVASGEKSPPSSSRDKPAKAPKS